MTLVAHSKRIVGAACLLALTALLPATAAAQPSPDAALAEALFTEGRALLAAGKAAEACPKLAKSHRLDPGGGVLLNLATCLEMEGKTATAWVTFREALGWARREGRADRVELAEAHLAGLEPRLARIQLELPGPPAPSEILVAGRPFSREGIGTATPVDPGPVKIVARWPDGATLERTIEARPAVVERVALERPVVPPPPPPPPPDTTLLRTSGVVIGGLGLASLAFGAVLGVNALDRASESDRECAGGACSPRGDQLEGEASDLATAANVSLGVGVGLVAVGSVMFVLSGVEEGAGTQVAATWRLP